MKTKSNKQEKIPSSQCFLLMPLSPEVFGIPLNLQWRLNGNIGKDRRGKAIINLRSSHAVALYKKFYLKSFF